MLGIAGNGFVLSGKSRCGPKPPRWGFRAAHDRRLSAGPRQGSKTLDPGKNALHFSVIKNCESNFAPCFPFSPGALQLRRPAAGGGTQIRASVPHRFLRTRQSIFVLFGCSGACRRENRMHWSFHFSRLSSEFILF